MPVWHSVTVAFSLRRVSSRPSGRPTVMPRPTITTSAPAIGHVVPAQQLDDAQRGARQRRRGAEHEPAEVGRVQAVGVLVRVDQLQDRVLVDALGQRQLHDVAGAGRVLVELATASATCAWDAVAGSRRWIEAMPTCAQSRCLLRT